MINTATQHRSAMMTVMENKDLYNEKLRMLQDSLHRAALTPKSPSANSEHNSSDEQSMESDHDAVSWALQKAASCVVAKLMRIRVDGCCVALKRAPGASR